MLAVLVCTDSNIAQLISKEKLKWKLMKHQIVLEENQTFVQRSYSGRDSLRKFTRRLSLIFNSEDLIQLHREKSTHKLYGMIECKTYDSSCFPVRVATGRSLQ